jgi:UDP-N-acetylmuramate dehydrogenase
MQIGGARVSEHHANFLVNAGGATAADVMALMRLVQEKVREDSGIVLEPEVHFL